MKKKLNELTVPQFARLLLDFPKEHTVTIKPINTNDEEVTAIGTYDQLHECSIGNPSILKYIEDNIFDNNIDFDNVDIYSYLDEKTKGFREDYIIIVWDNMLGVYEDWIDEEENKAYDRYIEEDREIPYKTTTLNGETKEWIDYEKMRKTFCDEWCESNYQSAIGVLERQLRETRKLQGDKPLQKWTLEAYFDCTNFDYLRIVLNREVRGNGGRQLAVVLFALAEIGYKVKPRKQKPLFETILKPQYGAVGSLQAVTKYDCKEYDNDFTEEVDTLAAKFREELQKL